MHVIGDAHVYLNHIEPLMEQLARSKAVVCVFSFKCPSSLLFDVALRVQDTQTLSKVAH